MEKNHCKKQTKTVNKTSESKLYWPDIDFVGLVDYHQNAHTHNTNTDIYRDFQSSVHITNTK